MLERSADIEFFSFSSSNKRACVVFFFAWQQVSIKPRSKEGEGYRTTTARTPSKIIPRSVSSFIECIIFS